MKLCNCAKKSEPKYNMEFMNCGSGFPAANRLFAGGANRGWKAAPTIKPTSKILKLTPIRLRGNDNPCPSVVKSLPF